MRWNKLNMLETLMLTLWASLAIYATWYFTSFKRATKIIENEPTSTPQVSRKRSSDTFPIYGELRQINAQLLKMERQKAEALQLIRNHSMRV